MTDVLVFDARPNAPEPLELPTAWQPTRVPSLALAQSRIAERPADVVIIVGDDEPASGLELLATTRNRHPDALCLSIVTDTNARLSQSIDSPAHSRLVGSPTGEDLAQELDRRARLQAGVSDPSLVRFMAGIDGIPSFPQIYDEMVAELQKPNSDLQRIARILMKDPGLTARVLQIVNSPFYGMRRRIHDTVQAIGLLGMQNLLSMVLAAEVFNAFDAGAAGLSLNRLWGHSTATAACARRIAQQAGCSPDATMMAFVAGVLHDSGRLVLGSHVPHAHRSFVQAMGHEDQSFVAAERDHMGVTHAEVGAYLLNEWNLPTAIVEAVAFHHEPSLAREAGFTPLTAVHLAEVFQQEYGADGVERGIELDVDYLTAVGVMEYVEEWRELCRPDHD